MKEMEMPYFSNLTVPRQKKIKMSRFASAKLELIEIGSLHYAFPLVC
jgi:hypothetical protein